MSFHPCKGEERREEGRGRGEGENLIEIEVSKGGAHSRD